MGYVVGQVADHNMETDCGGERDKNIILYCLSSTSQAEDEQM